MRLLLQRFQAMLHRLKLAALGGQSYIECMKRWSRAESRKQCQQRLSAQHPYNLEQGGSSTCTRVGVLLQS